MKQTNYNTLLCSIIAIAILCASCASPKIVVHGKRGTEIYDPSYNKLGTISNEGYAKVKLPRNSFRPFLLSHEANGDVYIPFAIDYKRKTHVAGDIIATLGIFSGIALIPSTIYILHQSSQRSNNYKYLKKQTTNQDFTFVPFVDNGERKTMILANEPNAISLEPTDGKTSVRETSSASKRTLNDKAKIVSGTYSGSGFLTQSGQMVEEYATIKVLITRKDNNNVWVDVIEGGDSFFGSKSLYQIKKKGKNTYVLSLKDIPDAYITIDTDGALTYMHPKVNIDGDIYTLNIKAKRQ